MTKGGKALVSLLATFGILVVLPVTAIYGFFYDTTENPVTYDRTYEPANFFTDIFSNAVDNTKTTHKIEAKVTQQDLNNFLYATLIKNENFPNQLLDQVYMEVEGDNYIFNVSVTPASFFSTKLKLYTKLSFELDSDGDEAFIFTITNCKIARVGKLDNLAVKIAKNYISDEELQDYVNKAGVNVKVSLEQKKISYKEKDLIKDIDKFVSTDSKNANLLINVITNFLEKDYVSFDFHNEVDIYADLEPFAENKYGLLDDTKSQNLDLDRFSQALPDLYAKGIIDPEHYNQVFKYFVYGYDEMDSDTKTYLDDKNFTSVIGTTPNNLYKGTIQTDHKDLLEVIDANTTAYNDIVYNGKKEISFMTEEQANQYIAGSGFIGYTYLLTNHDKSDVNYIVIDNFYCNLFREDSVGYFPIVAGLNFNGYETSIAFDMREEPTLCSGYRMGFKVENIYFGEYKTEDTLTDFLFKLMSDSLANDKTLIIDYDARTICVDFTEALSADTKSAVAGIGTPSMRIEGTGLNDNDGKVVAYIVE